MSDILLGKPSAYPERYAPDILRPIPRREARARLGLRGRLPFGGVDVWNAWELTWLDAAGKPVVATATIRFPADSANVIESKSLKLYLNGFALCRYASANELGRVIGNDLGRVAGTAVGLCLTTAAEVTLDTIASLPGTCIDDVVVDSPSTEPPPDASVLRTSADNIVTEALHSHLLRSLCPVTEQPDTGSLLVRYRGARIDRASLLEYVVSYRRHSDFHESCVERMFMDLKARCGCEALTVYARYNRRGGIDINPFRSDFETTADNPRLWRQ